MSDQRLWIKLWLCWRTDSDIERLSYADRGRWLELLLLVAEHGSLGQWSARKGVRTLPSLWRRGLSDREVCNVLDRMPGVVVHYGSDPLQPMVVEFTHWHKYQVDSSAARVRRWRSATVTRNGHSSESPGQHVTGEIDREIETPLTPHAVSPLHDCGHTGADITKATCSDRHFAARRAFLGLTR